MTPIIDLLAFRVDFDVVDTLSLIPSRANYPRVQLDIRMELVFVGKALKVLSLISDLEQPRSME